MPQTPTTSRLFVGTRKGLFTYEHAPDWRITATAFLAEPVTIMLPDGRDGTLYVGLKLGHFGVKLHRSEDGGATWAELPAPAYPAKPEGVEDKHPWSLEQLWALEAGGPDQPGRIWAGTLPGGLFKSDDRGDSWQLVRSLWDRPERQEWFGGGYDVPGIHSISVDPRDSKHLTVAVSCGGVWQSFDDGESWEVTTQGMYAAYMPPERREDPLIQDPHRLVQCPAHPDQLWVAHHNAVFQSRDGGRSWLDVATIEPSAFGFAAAVHPSDPKTAWFVPAVKDECRIPVDAKLVVAKTKDGGESFEVIRRGLPQEHAYHLVYRHSLDVAPTGRELAMGSTTGALFVSDDGGDSWRALSHHLPPIACVRFG